MILILASMADTHAVSFAGEFSGAASVLTSNDLARGPLRLFHPDFARSTITVDGRAISVREISAVLNLLPAVMARELVMYAEEERSYQAAEMRALLIFFLSSLSCMVINRATPMSFSGPVQNPAAWLAVAQGAGIPLASLSAGSAGQNRIEGEGSSIEVVRAGDSLVIGSGTVADDYTAALARRVNLPYLRAVYRQEEGEVRLAGADSYPDIRNPQIRSALRELLQEAA
jgi:hypothetical protein